MDVFLSISAFVLAFIGIAGCIIPVLPGVVLSYAGLLCAYGCSHTGLTPNDLWIWLAVTVAVTAVDYVLPAYMAKLFGGSRSGMIGATIGAVAGFFIFPPIGILLGPFAGAVAGELLHDGSNSGRAFRVGFGSFLSFIVGTGLKLGASIGILILIWGDTVPAVKSWAEALF